MAASLTAWVSWLYSPMPERRRTKRVSARLKVWCEGDDFTLLAETANVSSAGMFVKTSSLPPSSKQFKVTIEELSVTAQVEVRWTRSGRDPGRGGMGLQITAFEAGATEFQHFIDKNRSGEIRVASLPQSPPDDAGEDGEPS
jgi:hypothetical protein